MYNTQLLGCQLVVKICINLKTKHINTGIPSESAHLFLIGCNRKDVNKFLLLFLVL